MRPAPKGGQRRSGDWALARRPEHKDQRQRRCPRQSGSLILTAGQAHDIGQAEELISGFRFENLLADKGYDSDRFRARIAEAKAQAVIPSRRSRSQAIPYDKVLYAERNLVERFINKIKHFRIATRYEKTVLSFASMLFLVGAMIWLR